MQTFRQISKTRQEISEFLQLAYPVKYHRMLQEITLDEFMDRWENRYNEKFNTMLQSDPKFNYNFDEGSKKYYCQNSAIAMIFNEITRELDSESPIGL